MLGWMLDPDSAYWPAVALLWAFLIISVPIAIIVTAFRAIWAWMEKRDGKRD